MKSGKGLGGKRRAVSAIGERRQFQVAGLNAASCDGAEDFAIQGWSGPQQDDAGGLDEQGAQVLVAAFGDLASK